jgi:hypothetical protein
VIFTTVFVTRSAAWAQSPAAASVLPIGSPLTIICDDTVDGRVRPGSEFRAHLRDPLTLGDTLVATAGTPARIVVTSKDIAKDGTPSYRIAIVGLNLGLAGTLPVRPNTPKIDRVTAGMAIPATTLAALGFEAGKVRVALPLPFKLSNEPPNGGYTPAPLRTASPIINNRGNRRRSTPSPNPSASASPAAPSASPSPAPLPSAQPGASATP